MDERNDPNETSIEEYEEGEVFCAVCFKELTAPDDIKRGFHRHCKGKNGFTDDEMTSIFCGDKPTRIETQKGNP